MSDILDLFQESMEMESYGGYQGYRCVDTYFHNDIELILFLVYKNIVTFFIPLVIMIINYGQISWTLWKSKKVAANLKGLR